MIVQGVFLHRFPLKVDSSVFLVIPQRSYGSQLVSREIDFRIFLDPEESPTVLKAAELEARAEPPAQKWLEVTDGYLFWPGKVTLTGKVPAGLDCTYSINYLVRREPGIAPPPEIANLGFDVRDGWRGTWLKTVEGQAYFSTLQSWFVKLAPDGAFRISGVPPGDYDLAVGVYAKPDG